MRAARHFALALVECIEVIACLERLLKEVDLRGMRRFVMFADVGPHFRNCTFLAYWLTHLLEKYTTLDECELVFFPEHHGKGPVDAHFGTLRAWKDASAQSAVISTLDGYVEALRLRGDAASRQGGALYEFYAFTPPARSMLPLTPLDATYLRDNHCSVKTVYNWRGRRVGGATMISTAPLAGLPLTHSIRPCFGEVAKGLAEAEWRMAYRALEPERSAVKLGTLSRVWEEYKTTPLNLALRRASWSERCQAFLHTRARNKAASETGRAVLQMRRGGVGAAACSSR